ncbi:unnamed protein product, partial [Phaeothamnion confervicola]
AGASAAAGVTTNTAAVTRGVAQLSLLFERLCAPMLTCLARGPPLFAETVPALAVQRVAGLCALFESLLVRLWHLRAASTTGGAPGVPARGPEAAAAAYDDVVAAAAAASVATDIDASYGKGSHSRRVDADKLAAASPADLRRS